MSGEVESPKDELDELDLDEEQKRRLRAVRRGYRAQAVEIKNNGWEIEIRYMDGSTAVVNSKLVKLKARELSREQ